MEHDHLVTEGRNKPKKPPALAPGDSVWLRFNVGRGNSDTAGITAYFGSSYMQMRMQLFEDDKVTPVKNNAGDVIDQSLISTASIRFSNPTDRTPAGGAVPCQFNQWFQLKITKEPEASEGPFGLDTDLGPFIDHH